MSFDSHLQQLVETAPLPKKKWSTLARSQKFRYLGMITKMISWISHGEVEGFMEELFTYTVNKGLVKKVPEEIIAQGKKVLSHIATLYVSAPPKAKSPILSTVAGEFSFALLRQVGFTCGSWQYKKHTNQQN